MRLDFRNEQFLKHPIHDCVLHTTWDEERQKLTIMVRFSGAKEYEVDYTTKMFNDAVLQPEVISESEYFNF